MLLAFSLLIAVSLAQTHVQLDLPPKAREVVLSPDGRTCAFSQDGNIYTRSRTGKEPPRLLDGADGTERTVSNPRWSPDGTRLLYTESWSHFGNNLVVKDLATGAVQRIGAVCHDAPQGAWSPDGRFIIFGMPIDESPGPSKVVLRSATDGRVIRSLSKSGQAGAISPDGKLAAVADEGVLRTIDLKTGRQSGILANEPWTIYQIDWTPDGQWIVYQVWGDAPYVRRVRPNRPRTKPAAIPGVDGGVTINQILPDGTSALADKSGWEELIRQSPDGRRRAILSSRTGTSEVWIGNRPVWSNPVRGRLFTMEWSPDATRLLLWAQPSRTNADFRSHVYIADATRPSKTRRIGKQAEALDQPRWSHDGKWIYAARDGATLVRVDPDTGKILPLRVDEIAPAFTPAERTTIGDLGAILMQGIPFSAPSR